MTQSMLSNPTPSDETERLAELDSYKILDTPEEQAFNHITELASRFFEVPIALVSLVAKERQWFKANVGLNATETSRDVSFCAHAIRTDETMVVPNACDDPRFVDNPLVTGDPDIRFYAGAPLITPSGHRLGTLCVIDTLARPTLMPEEERTLVDLAALVMDRLNLRRAEMTQKQLEATLVDRNQALEDQQARLETALCREKELTGLQGQFISMVNHEFRTPLAVIDGNAHRLIRKCDQVSPDQLKRGMEKTRRSIGQLTDLMESVLSAARLDAGAIKFAPRSCNPAREIFALAENYRALNPLHQIVANLEHLPDQISMDINLMRQAFSNLISNAIKYSPEKTHVWIEGKADVDGGITIAIRDEGPGIPPSEIKHLFEKFYRASTSVGIPGSGVGLFLADVVVNMHGGKIDVVSEEGKGTEFSVHLPACSPA